MAAEEILRFALFKEVLRAERRKRRKLNNGVPVDGDGEGSGAEEEQVEAVTKGERERAKAKARRLEREEEEEEEALRAGRQASTGAAGGARAGRQASVRPGPAAPRQAAGDDEDEDMDGAEASLGVDITDERYVSFHFDIRSLFPLTSLSSLCPCCFYPTPMRTALILQAGPLPDPPRRSLHDASRRAGDD
jgi:DNA replication licensing factor MCM3